MPHLPLETYHFIRTACGVLMACFFALIIPFGRPYFTASRYGGCIKSTPANDIFFHPAAYYAWLAVWTATSVMLIFGIQPLAAAFINFLFCRTFFIQMRWTTPLRGMGAPGFISYWLSAFLLLAEYALTFGDPGLKLFSLVVFAFQVDYGIMMIDSGINKIFHGYPNSHGMNFGMANPAWGYWPDFFKKIPHDHWFYNFLNHSAYLTQIAGGILMLIPETRWLGAFTIFSIFLIVKFLIRLGVLCDKLMLITFIFTASGGWIAPVIARWFSPVSLPSEPSAFFAALNTALTFFLWAYIICLPMAKLAMYTNFYLQKTLPAPLQKSLEGFTGFFGVILWRVFTIDLIDYFMRVYFEDKKTGKRTLYTRFGAFSFRETNRFLWVGESIMSVIVFNTARYFPQTRLFHERVLRYANTMPCPEGSRVIFEYVVLYPTKDGFDYRIGKEYRVDPKAPEPIQETILDEEALAFQKRRKSPVRGSAKPGSYAPIR